MRRMRRSFGERGVLLGHLVEMGDGLAHLVDAFGLLARGRRDVGDGGGDLLRVAEDLAELVAAWRHQLHTLADSMLEEEIRPEMSLAAALERWASVRTSEATTAKPLPASPARAASTAALSASRLSEGDVVDHPDDVGDLGRGGLDARHRLDGLAGDRPAALSRLHRVISIARRPARPGPKP